jgi:hypothetical protein
LLFHSVLWSSFISLVPAGALLKYEPASNVPKMSGHVLLSGVVRRQNVFMEGASGVRDAIQAYVKAVKDGSFPVDDTHGW